MGKVKTKVVNKTGGEILLQEGNQNVYTVIAKLRNDKEFVIILDPNATYRDYVFLIMPNRAQLESSISSDDCLEYSQIKVMRGANDTYHLERVSRNTPAPGNITPAPGNATPAPGNATPAPDIPAPNPGIAVLNPGISAPAPGNVDPALGTAAPVPSNAASESYFQKIKEKVYSLFGDRNPV